MKTWTLHFIITMFAVTGFATTTSRGSRRRDGQHDQRRSGMSEEQGEG